MIAQLTDDQAKELTGKEWQPDSFFAPFKTQNGWAISEQEVNGCETKGLEWVCKLPLVDYVPEPTPIP
jgi:hypothetical protein